MKSLIMMHLYSGVVFGGSGTFVPGSVSLFILGSATGVLVLCSLARIRWLNLSGKKQIPAKEYQFRIAATVSIFCTALGMGFLAVSSFSEYCVIAGSFIQVFGFLGFCLFLMLLLLFRCFPHWQWKQLIFLPILTIITVLLPLFGLKAPFVFSCFSFALGGLCVFLFFCFRKQKPRFSNSFLWGMVFFIVPGVSFIFPPGPGAFFRSVALLIYLLLEHRFFTEIAKIPVDKISADVSAKTAFLEHSAKLQSIDSDISEESEIDIVEELVELEEENNEVQPAPVTETTLSMASFVPREYLSILNKKNIAELKLGDHIEQEMTIFFSDIRQFTELAEDLTIEEIFAFINSYLSRIVPEITKYGGFVDKYIGDAILALFPQENGAGKAVQSAIAIQEKIQEYNFHRSKCDYRPLSIGIGIHTGNVIVGVIGTEERMQNTVISDAVNLASRVESLTKAFRVSLAISDETFKKLEDPGSYQYRFVGKVRVKGKTEPVSIFEIFDGIDEKLQRKKVQANRFFEQGMFLYYQKKYPEALQEFRHVLEFLPDDGASAFYIDNCMAKLKQSV